MRLRTVVLFCFVATTGCASGHGVMRGSVVMKIDEAKAHVCLGNGEVAINDHVRLYKNVCTQADRRPTCKKEVLADGTITELLDEHYSVATFPTGTAFEVGNTVEKVAE